MRESTVQKLVWLRASAAGARLFRNNVGLFVAWEAVQTALKTGSLSALRRLRPIRCGLIKGSSDLIGWTPVTITPEHVGQTLAVFTALEIKRDARQRPTPEQTHFLNAVVQAGGIAQRIDDPARLDLRPKLTANDSSTTGQDDSHAGT